MQNYVQMYGNASNFYGGWGECCHIEWIKDNSLRTQRHASNFNEQIGERICEGVILKTAEDTLVTDLTDQMDLLSISTTHLRNRFGDMSNTESSNDINALSTIIVKSVRGGYSVTVTVEEAVDKDHLGNAFIYNHTFSHTIIWNSDDKEKQCIGRISFELEYFLIQRSISLQTSRLIVTGYREAHIQFSNLPLRTVVRCTDNYREKLWYDFVMVRKNEVILPGKVVGLIEVEEEIKFVIHSAIVKDGFNRVSTMQKILFPSFCPWR
jgi:hypothetical protein